MSENLLRVRLQLRLDERLARFIRIATSFVTIELDNAIYAGDDKWFEYLTLEPADETVSPEAELGGVSGIDVLDVRTIGNAPPIYYTLLFVDEVETFLLFLIASNQAIPHRIVIDDSQLRAVVTLRDWNHLKEFADLLEETYDGFELLGTQQVETAGFPLGGEQLKHTVRGKLTNSQLMALEVAHQMGYFQVPQESTGREVADRLGISQSVASERLRHAQQRLFDILFGQTGR